MGMRIHQGSTGTLSATTTSFIPWSSIILLALLVCQSIATSEAWTVGKDFSGPFLNSGFNTYLGQKMPSSLSSAPTDGGDHPLPNPSPAGRLEELKQREAELNRQLAAIRSEKQATLRSRPLTIGVVGFGRFGQFIAKTFANHANVVGTSRSDYSAIAEEMGATYVPLDDPEAFLEKDLDVIIMAVSIVSFESTVKKLLPTLEEHVRRNGKGPLLVDVLSVKEHAREVMLQYLPKECDILCTHPMFGPDSGRDGWQNLNFVYEMTRIDGVLFDPEAPTCSDTVVNTMGTFHSIHDGKEAHVESMDRAERFLSIWEEEGCRMVPMSCKAHDEYAANSQFITHLMGRILGTQGLSMTPIDTKGFESVLQLVDSTTADSFDLFYGLYKYNQNSVATIQQLKAAMDNVVENLHKLEREDQEKEKLRAEQQTINGTPN